MQLDVCFIEFPVVLQTIGVARNGFYPERGCNRDSAADGRTCLRFLER
jgi:hypothetical protein